MNSFKTSTAVFCIIVAFLFVFKIQANGTPLKTADSVSLPRVKRFEWPWDIVTKELCKTAADCSCGWAKCVRSPGYKASNCCAEGFVWSCCGKAV